MRKNAAFTFNNGVIDENYDDTLNATCPVKYDWVFRDEKLSKCASWISKITQDVSIMEKKKMDTLDPDLGVFRRIAHFMSPHFELFVDPIREILQTFKRGVKLGAQVDGDDKKRIVLDLEILGDDTDIFEPNSKFEDFLSVHPRFKTVIEA
jgi:hypothetical protein